MRLIVLDDKSEKLETVQLIADDLGISTQLMRIKWGKSNYERLAQAVLREIGKDPSAVLILLDGTWTSEGERALHDDRGKDMDCVRLVKALNEIPDAPTNRISLYIFSDQPPRLQDFPDGRFKAMGIIRVDAEKVERLLAIEMARGD